MRDINPDPYGRHSEKGERSIRNIPVSRPVHHTPTPKQTSPRRRARSKNIFVWGLLVVVACITAGVGLSTIFAGAKVTVSPRVEAVTPPSTITATVGSATGSLVYEPVVVSRTATTTVPATGTKEVSRQASGVITIENKYSAQTQRLIANTRFEATDGKIYRIRDSVVVPGMQGSAAGSITATVYADSPGESYNRPAGATFTIPGFKGDPRYSAFVARSAGPISGGFVGTEPAVAESELSKARAELQKKLDADIASAAVAAIPEGYVAVPGTLEMRFGSVATAPASGNSATVVQTAEARGAMVRVANLASAIARSSVQGYAGEAVTLDSSSQLDVSASTTSSGNTLVMNLNGTAVLVWQFDPQAVKQALAGRPRSEFDEVLKTFAPALRCAATTPCEASIRPFWQSSFPESADKITLFLRLPQ